MHETRADKAALQALLDESFAAGGEHLRSVFSADRALTANDLSDLLTGAFALDLAVVTKSGAPLVAPVDGIFFRGKVWFSFPPGSVRGRILRSRPAVSATHTRGDQACFIVHGVAREVRAGSPEYAAYETCLREVYGDLLDFSRAQYKDRIGEEFSAWIEARKFFATRPSADPDPIGAVVDG